MCISSFRKIYRIQKAGISILIFLYAAPMCTFGQESSDRLVQNRQDDADNTGPFTISGDRLSTVDSVAEPIIPPSETRSIESLPNLRENEKPLSRNETFTEHRGTFACFDGFIGSNTPLNMTTSASVDDKDSAGTIRLHLRNQKQNTPTNLAPQIQNFGAFGYRNSSLGKMTGDIRLNNESDNMLGNFFRFQDRRRESYSAGVGLKPSPRDGWGLDGQVRLAGGNYRDFKTHDDVNELNLSGKASLSGNIDEISVSAGSTAGLFRMAGRTGSMFQFGADGVWLPMSELSIKGGADLYISSLPGENARVRFCPEATAKWAISGSSFAGLIVKREVILHTFSDLYGSNGLAAYSTPLLFEDRIYDITAQYGCTLTHTIRTTAELFSRKSEHAPIFSRKGSFFEIIPDASVTLTGVKVKAAYDLEKLWGAEGEFTIKKASWNFSGNVPYIPLVEVSAGGYVIPYPLWKLYGSLTFMGTHYVEKGSDDTAKAFLTIDIGAEREIWKKNIDAYVDIKNLLNSSGAWWTDEYKIPGIGVYAGIKAKY